jgi:hypothetical protein
MSKESGKNPPPPQESKPKPAEFVVEIPSTVQKQYDKSGLGYKQK